MADDEAHKILTKKITTDYEAARLTKAAKGHDLLRRFQLSRSASSSSQLSSFISLPSLSSLALQAPLEEKSSTAEANYDDSYSKRNQYNLSPPHISSQSSIIAPKDAEMRRSAHSLPDLARVAEQLPALEGIPYTIPVANELILPMDMPDIDNNTIHVPSPAPASLITLLDDDSDDVRPVFVEPSSETISPIHRYMHQITQLKESILDARLDYEHTSDVNQSLVERLHQLEHENKLLKTELEIADRLPTSNNDADVNTSHTFTSDAYKQHQSEDKDQYERHTEDNDEGEEEEWMMSESNGASEQIGVIRLRGQLEAKCNEIVKLQANMVEYTTRVNNQEQSRLLLEQKCNESTSQLANVYREMEALKAQHDVAYAELSEKANMSHNSFENELLEMQKAKDVLSHAFDKVQTTSHEQKLEFNQITVQLNHTIAQHEIELQGAIEDKNKVEEDRDYLKTSLDSLSVDHDRLIRERDKLVELQANEIKIYKGEINKLQMQMNLLTADAQKFHTSMELQHSNVVKELQDKLVHVEGQRDVAIEDVTNTQYNLTALANELELEKLENVKLSEAETAARKSLEHQLSLKAETSDNNAHELKLQMLQSENEALRQQVDTLNVVINDYKTQLDVMQDKSNRIERTLRDELAKAHTKLQLSDQYNSQIVDAKERKEKATQVIQDHLSEKERALEKALVRIAELEAQVTQCNTELDNSVKVLDKISKEETKVNSYRIRTEQLETQCTKMKTVNNELEIVLEDLTKERDTLLAKCRKYNTVLSNLQRQQQPQRQRTASSEMEVASLNKRIADSNSSIRDLQERCYHLTERFDATQKKWLDVQQELAATRSRCAQLETERQALRDVVTQLKEELSDARSHRTRDEVLSPQRDKYEKEISSLHTTVDELRQLHREAVQGSESRLAMWTTEQQKFTDELTLIRKERDSISARMIELEHELSEVRERLLQEEQEKQRLNADITEFVPYWEETQRQLVAIEQLNKRLEEECGDLKRQLSDSLDQLNTRQTLEECKTTAHNMEHALEQWVARCSELEESLTAKTISEEATRRQIEELEKTINQGVLKTVQEESQLRHARISELTHVAEMSAQQLMDLKRKTMQSTEKYEQHLQDALSQQRLLDKSGADVQEKLSPVTQAYEHAMLELNKAKTRERDAEARLSSLYDVLAEHQQESDELQQQLTELKISTADQTLINQRQKQLKSKNNDQQELERLTENLTQAQNQLAKLRETYDTVEKNEQSLVHALQYEKEMSAQLQNAYDQDTPMLQQCIQDLNGRIHTLEAENLTLRQYFEDQKYEEENDAEYEDDGKGDVSPVSVSDEETAEHARFFELLPIPRKFRKMIWSYRNQLADLGAKLATVEHQLLCVEAELAAEREVLAQQSEQRAFEELDRLRTAGYTKQSRQDNSTSSYNDIELSPNTTLNSVDDLQDALNHNLEVMIDDSNNLNDELQEARDHLQALVDRYAGDLTAAEKLIHRLNYEKDDLTQQLVYTRTDYERLQKMLVDKDAIHQAEIETLHQQLRLHTTTIAQLKRLHHDAECSWNEQRVALLDKIIHFECDADTGTLLQRQVEDLKGQCKTLVLQKEELEQTQESLQSQLSWWHKYTTIVLQDQKSVYAVIDMCLPKSEMLAVMIEKIKVLDLYLLAHSQIDTDKLPILDQTLQKRSQMLHELQHATNAIAEAATVDAEFLPTKVKLKLEARYRQLAGHYHILKQKYNRQVRLRASLITQKRYLVQLVRTYQTTETQTWDIMAEMGFTRPQPRILRSPYQKLRRCLLAVLCAIRLNRSLLSKSHI